MQKEMHFYGTYVIARCAGLPSQDAHTVAYAAQFVDDSTQQDSERHADGGMLYGIATAHHAVGAALNAAINREEQRRVWIPFHFFPGGAGETLEEKLLCLKDGPLLQIMMERHLAVVAREKPAFGMELLGVAAHVYLDPFAHYGFSGISSPYNSVEGNSFQFIDADEAAERTRGESFRRRYGRQRFASFLTEQLSGSLGHGSVMTYPDKSYLHWCVTFEKDRPGNGAVSDRNNPSTYLEGCEKFHTYLRGFVRQYYADGPTDRPFAEIRQPLGDLITNQTDSKDERLQLWRDAIDADTFYTRENGEQAPSYTPDTWEDQKQQFHQLPSSAEGITTHAYRFHQAAALHRYYVLKDLLPAHGIVMY